ncbi:MAG: hypothetical protein HYW33_00210 [Candidatus Blackburnbacteria bacterium]|nr:hypothetical protein [Candidatus Blackburnbacteria bacterium]
MSAQRGTFSLFILILIAVVSVVAFLLFKGGIPQNHDRPSNQSQAEWPVLWGGGGQNCEDNPSVKYTFSPINIEDVSFILPIGELRESHIVPGDHAGIVHQTSPTSIPTKVFAPADGTIVRVEKHLYQPPSGYPKDIRHYHVYIMHSCTLFTGFVHITDFTPEVFKASPDLKKLHDENLTEMKSLMVNIPVKAGQQIGAAWSFELLGWLTVDLTKTNKGYLRAQSYKAENWRPHSVSPFNYFEEPLSSKLQAKNPRKDEPKGGKIDFDLEGKAVGNWFEEGSGGFRDESKPPKQCGNWPCPYWEGHLSLVYDFIDPLQLRVSVGFNSGLEKNTPYGVLGNGPDFKDIGVKDGAVKYELVSLKDVSREKGYISEASVVTVGDESRMLGTMLVQVLENRQLKMEIFPGRTKDQVNGFTSKAKNYTR